jgi:hypothetical protein
MTWTQTFVLVYCLFNLIKKEEEAQKVYLLRNGAHWGGEHI